MPKYKSLSNSVLKEILRTHELPTTGNKAELVNRLSVELDTDEIEGSELATILRQPDVNNQRQISDIQNTLDQVVQTIQTLMSAVQQRTERSPTSPREDPSQAGEAEPTQAEVVEPILTDRERNPEPVATPDMVENAGIRTSMRDVIAVLPEFDPSRGYHASDKFIQKIENLMRVYNWPESVVLYAIQCKLKGYAKTWLDSQDIFETWQQFVEMFLNDFPIIKDAADIHIEMIRNRQKRDETNLDYYYRVLALGRQGKLDERSIIKHCINGLQDENAQKTLSAMQFEACSSFVKALTGITSPTKPYRQISNAVPTVFGKYEKPTGSQNTDRKPFICYNCNEPGHVSVNCPKPQLRKRCGECNKVHAKGTTCVDKKQANALQKYEQPYFEMLLIVENRSLKALVDTGSQSSLIKRSIGETLQCEKEGCRVTILGICGGVQTANQRCRTEITVDEIKMFVTLLFIEDALMSTDVLLGQDVFENNDVRLTVEKGKTTITKVMPKQIYKAEQKSDSLIEDKLRLDIDDEHIRKDFLNLLEKYTTVFSTGLRDIGKTDLVNMEINVKPNEVICQKPYRVPFPKRDTVDRMIDEMIEHDIIAPSESIFASPIILTKKKDGSDRL